MSKRKRRPKKFSVTKAIKTVARERLGQPKAERIIEDRTREDRRKSKHKETLGDLLERADE